MNQNTQSENPTISPDLARRLQENFRGGPIESGTADPGRSPQGGTVERAAETQRATNSPELAPELAKATKELLRAHLAQLEPGLAAAEGGPQIEGVTGQPSILARTSGGAHVIVEFSHEEAAMDELTRTLCFMGALQERVQQPVRGILVASRFSQPVRLAARMVPGLQLKTFSLSFVFGDGAASP